ncbi:MAG: hypothetical protein ACE5ER_01705 [Nitrospinaceae bacterium]
MRPILLIGFLGILIPVCAGSVGPVAGTVLSASVEAAAAAASAPVEEPPTKKPGFLESAKAKALGWVKGKFSFLTEELDQVFGFEKGEGSKAFFGTIFFVIFFLFGLFFFKFFYNIIRDILSSLLSRDKNKRP